MGYAAPIIGHVMTVTRGISLSDAAAGAQGLPNVDPVYTWVRSKRVPIRIAIDREAEQQSPWCRPEFLRVKGELLRGVPTLRHNKRRRRRSFSR